ncbi:MAG: tRNA (adenosine(37)-N6)-threonylcarbamoyltransferase complex dimerization subunit type 1 TsaB [Betaproteobacteria bacterium]
MKLLAFDTSTHWLSVACGGGESWCVRGEPAGQTHSERLLPLVAEVLAEAGWSLRSLDGIAFGAGPGAFTGVRIACGVAQGLALGASLPLVPVPTLEALAQATWRKHATNNVFACLDARMREVYFAAYMREGGSWRETLAPAVMRPADVALPACDVAAWFGAGGGFAAHPDLAQQLGITEVDPDAVPDARAIGELAQPRLAAGEGVAARDALPLYVRHRVALTTAERAAGARL